MKTLINILNIIIIFTSFILITIKVLSSSGFKIKNISYQNKHKIDNINKKDNIILKKIFIYSLSFRVIIFLISVIIYYVFLNSEPFSITNIINNYVKWDALHYLRISHSYTYYIENGLYPTLAFFPLYPLLIKIFNIFINYRELSGLIISFISYSLACVYIFKLVTLDYNKNIAYKTLILISISPFAFFFGTIMSESIFLLFSTLTLYHIRKHNWFLTSIFGFLSALSRIPGVLLIIPAIVELLETYKPFKNFKLKNAFSLLKKLILFLIIPAGFVVYIFINKYVTGDYLYFTKIQKIIWSQTFTPPHYILYNLIDFIKNYNTELSFTIFIPELCSVLFMYILLITNINKQRSMYSIWFFVYILINTSSTWPLSISRYFICALPAYIFLANYLQKKKKIYYIFTLVIFSILFTLFFIAYLIGRQVM